MLCVLFGLRTRIWFRRLLWSGALESGFQAVAGVNAFRMCWIPFLPKQARGRGRSAHSNAPAGLCLC